MLKNRVRRSIHHSAADLTKKKLNSEKGCEMRRGYLTNKQQAMTTYTITDLQGNEFSFSQLSRPYAGCFIQTFEKETGIDFNRVDLFWKDVRLTSSLRFMKEHIGEATELLMVVSDKPVRVMDSDIDRIRNTLSDQELHSGLWHTQSTMLEDTYGPVEEWDVSFVTKMYGWFGTELGFEMVEPPTELFNRDISKWDVSSVRLFDSMFFANSEFNQDLSKWDVSRAVNMDMMFTGASSFKQNLSAWESKVSF